MVRFDADAKRARLSELSGGRSGSRVQPRRNIQLGNLGNVQAGNDRFGNVMHGMGRGVTKTFDFLSTLLYGSANVVDQTIKHGPRFREMGSQFREGVDRQVTYHDVLDTLGVGGKANAILGFGANVVLDPLTYVPLVGAAKKFKDGAQLAKFGRKGAIELSPKGARLYDDLVRAGVKAGGGANEVVTLERAHTSARTQLAKMLEQGNNGLLHTKGLGVHIPFVGGGGFSRYGMTKTLLPVDIPGALGKMVPGFIKAPFKRGFDDPNIEKARQEVLATNATRELDGERMKAMVSGVVPEAKQSRVMEILQDRAGRFVDDAGRELEGVGMRLKQAGLTGRQVEEIKKIFSTPISVQKGKTVSTVVDGMKELKGVSGQLRRALAYPESFSVNEVGRIIDGGSEVGERGGERIAFAVNKLGVINDRIASGKFGMEDYFDLKAMEGWGLNKKFPGLESVKRDAEAQVRKLYEEVRGVVSEGAAFKDKSWKRPEIRYVEDPVSSKFAGAQYDRSKNLVTINRQALQDKFEAKAWTKPRVEGVDALPANSFNTADEWIEFVTNHEVAHSRFPRQGKETLGQYENRINRIALDMMDRAIDTNVGQVMDNIESVAAELAFSSTLIRRMGDQYVKETITDPEILRGVQQVRKLFDEFIEVERASGLQINEQFGYVPHIYNEIKTGSPEEVMRAFRRDPGFAKLRSNLGSIADINEAAGEPILMDKLTEVVAMRYQQHKSILATRNLIDKAAQSGRRIDGNEALKQGEKLFKDSKGEDWAVPAEVVDHFRRVEEALYPEQVGEFMRAFDKVQNWWKAWSLGVTPGTPSRNLVGNLWNNFYAGIGVQDNVKGMEFVTAMYKGDWAGLEKMRFEVPGGSISGTEFRKMFEEYGFLDMGQYTRDINRVGTEVSDALFGKEYKGAGDVAKRLFSLSPSENPLPTFVLGLQSLGETQSYAAHFLGKLRQGYPPYEAMLSVKKYLFDYSDLTALEQKLRRLIPFYTFTARNLPLQIEYLFRKPHYHTLIHKTREMMRQINPEDREENYMYLPEWLDTPFAMPTPFKDQAGNNLYITLVDFIPSGQLDMFETPGRSFGGMVSPLVKTPIEVGANHNTFFDRPIEEYPGQPDFLLGLPLSGRVAHVLRQWRLLNEMDRLTGASDHRDIGAAQRSSRFLTGVSVQPFDPGAGRYFQGRERDPRPEQAQVRDRRRFRDNERFSKYLEGLNSI